MTNAAFEQVDAQIHPFPPASFDVAISRTGAMSPTPACATAAVASDHRREFEMSLFAVHRKAGPAWTEGKGAFEQPGVSDHAAFMNGLADDGLILAAGPLAGSESGRIHVLVIADADQQAEIVQGLAADPWERTGRIITTSIEPWTLLVGALSPPAQGRVDIR